MHLSRKLILLAAFMVGLGFVGSGELRAAALVESVTIASPDSGALLGIDDTYQVKVVVEDFLEDKELEIAIFLAQLYPPAEGSSTWRYEPFLDAEEQSVPSASSASTINLGIGENDPLGVANFIEALTIVNDVGVVVKKTRTEKGTILKDKPAVDGGDAQVSIDGDSLVLESTNNKKSVFVWHGKVHHSSRNQHSPDLCGGLGL